MKFFSLKIISPTETIYDGQCESLVISISDGLYGIQADHSPITAATMPCEAKITLNGEISTISLRKGLLHFENNEATIITE